MSYFFNILKKILQKHLLDNGNKNSEDNFFEKSKIANFRQIQKIWPFISDHKHKAAVATFLLIITLLLSLPHPLFTKYIIDFIVIHKNLSLLTFIVIILLLIFLLEAIFSLLRQFYFFSFEQDVILEIQQSLFGRVLRFPKSFFDSNQTGYLMSRLSGDVFRLRMLFSSTVIEIFTNVLKFFGGIVILFFLHWKLTLYSIIFLPFFYVTVRFLGEKTRQLSHNMMEKSAQVSKNLQESISGVTLIKAFAREEKATQKISDSLQDSIEAGVEQNTISAFSQLVIGIIGSLG
ncbi:MAG: ABC transporter ATP-binding protein, partial [Candidatus Hodarchaeota archaeon]